MKSIALLTIALFLASAPSPDSNTLSELSAGFLSANNAHPMMAAEPGQTIWQVPAGLATSTTLTAATPLEESLSQHVKQTKIAAQISHRPDKYSWQN